MAGKPAPRTTARRRQSAPEAPTASATPDAAGSVEHRLHSAATLIAHGQAGLASQALLPALDLRAAAGDRECALAAAALRLALVPPASPGPPTPLPEDALSRALDRLAELVRKQDAQIRILQDLLEATL